MAEINEKGDFGDILLDQKPTPALKTNTKSPAQKEAAAKAGNAVPGTILRAAIRVENWFTEGDSITLDCGAFEIDSCDYSGPPDIMSIKAVSTPIASSMRREEKNRAWEDVTLQKIAQDIADEAGLSLMYEVSEEIKLDRADQLQLSDMAFLQGLCKECGVALKVSNNNVVLFSEPDYESKAAVDSFDKSETRTAQNPGGRIISYAFSQDTSDAVSSAVVEYKDSKSGKLVSFEFEPPSPPATGQKFKLNKRPGNLTGDNYRNTLGMGGAAQTGELTSRLLNRAETLEGGETHPGTFDTGFSKFNETTPDFGDARSDVTDAALRQTKAAARDKNKHEWNADITMVGNPKMEGAVTVEITGFGVYSGKYIVTEAAHTAGGGYITQIKAHKVLEGY
jgi:phage protein D